MPLLLELKADGWTLKISGPARELPPHLPAAQTSVDVEAGASVKLRVFNPSSRQLEAVQPGQSLAPVFFENTSYNFYFTAENEGATLHLPPAAHLNHRADSLSHYTLNFRNDVGYAELRVESETEPATARIEVFPSKLDYRSDYIRMRDEVAGIARNLVLWVQARTFGFAEPAPNERPTLIEWRSLMEAYFEDLMAAGRAIARNPHSELAKTRRDVPPDRARQIGRAHV